MQKLNHRLQFNTSRNRYVPPGGVSGPSRPLLGPRSPGPRGVGHLLAVLDVLVAHELVSELPVEVGLDDVEARLDGPHLRVQPHRRARLGLGGVQRLHPGVPYHAARQRWVPLEDVPSVDQRLGRVGDDGAICGDPVVGAACG